MRFETAEKMLDYINQGHDLYSRTAKIFVFGYNKLLKGIEAFIKWDRGAHELVTRDRRIDVSRIDAEIADQIIQLALFGEIIYG